MSRTRRTHLEWKVRALGRDWTWEEEKAYHNSVDSGWYLRLGWNGHYLLDRNSRDSKPWNKPPKWFKRMKRKNERAQEKNALRSGKDIPIFRKTDEWEWS